MVAFLSAEADLISLNPGYSPPEEFFGVMESAFKAEEAFQKLKVAVQKNPKDLKANAGLALIYINRGKFEQGKPLFDKVLKQDPNNKTGFLPELYVNFAIYYGNNAAGNNEKDYFQKSEKVFPEGHRHLSGQSVLRRRAILSGSYLRASSKIRIGNSNA